MSDNDLQREARHRTLSAALRSIRRLRGARAQDLAMAMGLEPRTYERFEAGEGRLDLERIVRFAEVTGSDPLAIFTAVQLERPELAWLCADNKLQLVTAHALERLADRLGEDFGALDPARMLDALEQVIDKLAKDQEERARRAEDDRHEPR